MNGQVTSGLTALTSGWKSAPSVAAGDLDRARAALAASLAAGKTPQDLDDAVASRPVGANPVAAPAQPATGVLGFTQSALGTTVANPLAIPAWANGMARGQSFGPFIDAFGNQNTVTTFQLTQSHTFTYGTAANGFAVFPVTGSPSSATSLTLGAGSVWFEATLLASGAPAGSFCGFRIASGMLTSSAPVTLQSGAYVVPSGTTLTMTATLAPPAAGTGTPGADLTSATIALPQTVTIRFTQTTATVTALGNASLTLYGTKVGLSWTNPIAQLATGLPIVIVTGTADVTSFAFVSVKSTEFVPSGSAPVVAVGWGLPIATTTITALGDAAGAGSIMLGLGAGAAVTCAVRGETPASGWEISIDPTTLFVLVGGTGSVNQTSYTLWPGLPSARLHASVNWINVAALSASFLARPGEETLTVGGGAIAYLDRPMAADGGAFPISGLGVLSQVVGASQMRTTILGASPTPTTLDKYDLALENALIGVRAPKLFLIMGPTTGTAFSRADVGLLFDLLWLLPTLPDPYAATFDLSNLVPPEEAASAGLLVAAVAWTGSSALTFGFQIGAGSAAVAALDGGLALLDLSTRVDLFGVQIPTDNPSSGIGVIGVALALPDTAVATFALPQFSWEPMENLTPPPAPPALPGPPLGPLHVVPAQDGGATLVQSSDPQQTLVPLEPEPLLLQNIANVKAGQGFAASFSLPFGLTAEIVQPTTTPSFISSGGMFTLTQPSFPSQLTGAYQLTLKPPNPTAAKAQFAGTTNVSTAGASPGYGFNVLSSDVATIFQNAFSGAAGAVPINRIDLAGYGASIFSEWADDSASGPTRIIKVQFEAVRGRTAYEVVKAQTTMYPYCVPLVRTITITRQNSGWMARTDTGWVAAAPGIFKFPNAQFTQSLVNRGAIAGVYNVKNVQEFETVSAGAFTYRRATFDADIGLDQRVLVLQGGGRSATATDINNNSVSLVPATGLTGYVQITPDESALPPPPPPQPAPPPPPLTPAPGDLLQLFQAVGAISNPFSCVAQIGYLGSAPTSNPGTSLRCAAVEVDMVTKGAATPALGAALLAAPVLPKDGAWGFGSRASTAAAPTALPGNSPVPIVQPDTDPGNWHIANIVDVLQLATPDTVYGMLQDTGTQRILFEQPIIPDLTGTVPAGTVPSIQLPAGVAPVLADVGSLLKATGLFPDLASAVSMVASGVTEQLKTIPQGLQYEKKYPIPDSVQPTTLLDLPMLQVALVYQGKDITTQNPTTIEPTTINFNLDPAHTSPDSHGRNWWLTIGPLSFTVTVPQFSATDPLLTINGEFAADDQNTPGLTKLTIDFGSALNTLQAIFNNLQALASFLPGGAGAGLNVSLSNGKLTVRDTFAVPQLPLGLGNLTDVSVDLGLTVTLSPLSADFVVGIGSPDNPFNWVLSPLAGTGAIDIGVQGGQVPYLLIQAGLGLGLSIDVGIAEGSASVTVSFQLTVNGSAITVLEILNGQASVDVLDGLASVSLSLTAGVGVSIDPLPPVPPQVNFNGIVPVSLSIPSEDITFIAQVGVGIHISVCWVASVNFDGYWQFSQSIHTPALTVGL